MHGLQAGQTDAIAVDECSLEQLAERIGKAIARMMRSIATLDGGHGGLDSAAAEATVRRWISRLEPDARRQFLALVLSDHGYRHSARLGRAILRGEAWPLVDEPRRRSATGPVPACGVSP